MQLVNGKYSAEEIVTELERKFPDTNLRDDVIVFLKKVFQMDGYVKNDIKPPPWLNEVTISAHCTACFAITQWTTPPMDRSLQQKSG